jgi:hypothetical protein
MAICMLNRGNFSGLHGLFQGIFTVQSVFLLRRRRRRRTCIDFRPACSGFKPSLFLEGLNSTYPINPLFKFFYPLIMLLSSAGYIS